MSEKTIRNRIKENYEAFSAKELRVAEYVMENYQQSMLLSSTELAAAAGVSDTTVVRFAKSLGFSGFLQYRNQIKKEYVPTQKVYASLSSLADEQKNEEALIPWYFHGLLKNCNDFFNQIPENEIEKMVRLMKEAETVYLFGIGSDVVIAHFLENYLRLMGIRCIGITEEGLAMKEKFFAMKEHDCLFMSAYPTLEQSDYWVCDYVKRKNAKLLLLTDSELTAHKLNADVSINVKETLDTFFNSYVLSMGVCNAILLKMYELYPTDVSESMKSYQDMMLLEKIMK